jgi:hypothetical protein
MIFYAVAYVVTVVIFSAIIRTILKKWREGEVELSRKYEDALSTARNERFEASQEVYAYREKYGQLEADKPISPDATCFSSSVRLSKQLIKHTNYLLEARYPLEKTVAINISCQRYTVVEVETLKSIYEKVGWKVETSEKVETRDGKQYVLLFSRAEKESTDV